MHGIFAFIYTCIYIWKKNEELVLHTLHSREREKREKETLPPSFGHHRPLGAPHLASTPYTYIFPGKIYNRERVHFREFQNRGWLYWVPQKIRNLVNSAVISPHENFSHCAQVKKILTRIWQGRIHTYLPAYLLTSDLPTCMQCRLWRERTL